MDDETRETDWLYQSFMAHQHQKGHTVPKQVSPLDDDDDDDTTESTRKKCYGSKVWELHRLRTALCESIRYQAKSEQNVRQDLIPRVRYGEAALCTPEMNGHKLAHRASKDILHI